MRLHPRLGLLVIVTMVFTLSIDVTMLDIALRDVAGDLHADGAALGWIADTYNIALAGLLLVAAGLGGRYGHRLVFLVGLVIFGIGAIAAGVATTSLGLAGARVVMGIGAAGLASPSLALTALMFPGERRPRALAAWAAASALGLALGPVIGGAIIGLANWRWTFFVLVPFVLACLIAGRIVLPNGRDESPARMDVIGAVLSVLALVPLVAGILQAPDQGWASPWVVGGIIIGAAFTALFALRELRTPVPMIDLHVLRTSAVRGSAFALAASYVGFLGLQLLAALQLQGEFGLAPIAAGLVIVPFAVMFWASARVGAALVLRHGPVNMIFAGLAFLLTAFILLAFMSSRGSLWVGVCLAIAGTGCGLVIPIAVNLMVSSAPERLLSTTSGLSMVCRFGGGAVGIAVLASAAALGGAITWGYLAGAGLVGILGLCAAMALYIAPVHGTSHEARH